MWNLREKGLLDEASQFGLAMVGVGSRGDGPARKTFRRDADKTLGTFESASAMWATIAASLVVSYGAGGRTRTDMSLTSPDFESGAYTNFATPALRGKI